MTPGMRADARPFYRASMLGLDHALQHSFIEGELDAAQVILSLDFGVEMLLKAVLLNRKVSIMTGGKRSIGLIEALKHCGPYDNSSAIEVLRERRDGLQHFAQYTDAAATRDHYEATLLFVQAVLDKEFKATLPEELELKPIEVPVITAAEPIFDVPLLQRDVHASDSGIVVWAQAVENTSQLAVYVKQGSDEPKRLTPDDQFEYVPRTDGQKIVCYRQSGGVILYDLEAGTRSVISETGGFGTIHGQWIGAQGLSTEDGIGGGIWLWNMESKKWEQISEAGDTARLTDDYLFWQELEGDKVNIKLRPIAGGQTKLLLPGANNPSPDGDLIAWTEWGSDDWLHVTKLDGTEVYKAAGGIFPSLKGNLVAYLKNNGDTYELRVDDIERQRNVFSLPWVGFPMGSGPLLTRDEMFFESRANRATNAVWRTTAKLVGGSD